jgi:probable HAF family extracellular repeat protein
MQDLGALPGDTISFGEDINDAGEIVGVSIHGSSPGLSSPHTALLWQHGVPVNLNSLVVPGGSARLYLGFAASINSRGQIVGWGLTSTGEIHAFLATPVEGGDERTDFLPGAPAPVVVTEDAINVLPRRLHFGRFGTRITRPQ